MLEYLESWWWWTWKVVVLMPWVDSTNQVCCSYLGFSHLQECESSYHPQQVEGPTSKSKWP